MPATVLGVLLPRQPDLDLLGLTLADDGRTSRFELTPALARPDGALYGGTAIAVSVTAMEAASGRPALWVTTQYVASVALGETVEVAAEVLAQGRRISQVQVTGKVGERVVFVSLGSAANPRDDGLDGQFERMPSAPPPETAGAMAFGPMHMGGGTGFASVVEFRPLAETAPGGEGLRTLALWARLRDGRPLTPAGLAFLADMVPMGIARAAGKMGGGTSLDNSLRFGHHPEGLEWVLLDVQAHMAVGAHAHGSLRAWSPDGVLLAVGGQSANMGSHLFHAPPA